MDAGLCKRLFETLPRIEHGEVEAIACAPLHKMDIEYDQIIFYGTPSTYLR